MIQPSHFSWRRVAILIVLLWLGLIYLRAVGLVPWPWLVLLLPLLALWSVSLAFVVVCGVACLLLRCWLWLVNRAERRRRARASRAYFEAVQHELSRLLARQLPGDQKDLRRRP